MILRKLYKLLEKTGPRSLFVRGVTEYALSFYRLLRLGKDPRQRFVIYMQGRSGSSFFATCLISIPKFVVTRNYSIADVSVPFVSSKIYHITMEKDFQCGDSK